MDCLGIEEIGNTFWNLFSVNPKSSIIRLNHATKEDLTASVLHPRRVERIMVQ